MLVPTRKETKKMAPLFHDCEISLRRSARFERMEIWRESARAHYYIPTPGMGVRGGMGVTWLLLEMVAEKN